MQRDFATKITGGAFLAAALMLWAGWTLLPVHISSFFQPQDFPAIHAHRVFWIWMYRFHLFGMVATVLALVALGSLLSQSAARIVVWPGIAVAGAGFLISAVAAAFYYHFGAWGSVDMVGKPADMIRAFVDSLRVSTEYVTCLVRFGRVFSGLGLLILGLGLLKWKILPMWIALSAVGVGLAAMALTIDLELYSPLFHLQAGWLAATGLVALWSGIRFES